MCKPKSIVCGKIIIHLGHKNKPHIGMKMGITNVILLRDIYCLYTVGKKSIRALEIVLAIFLCFECQFLSFYACYKEYKA